jgi:hypothetical protein
MLALGVCDWVVGLMSLWKAMIDRFNVASDAFYVFSAHTYWVSIGLEVAASTSAALLAMFLSVDRCVALQFPLQHKERWSANKVKVLVVIVAVISLLVGITFPLRYRVSLTEKLGPFRINTYASPLNEPRFAQACFYAEFLLRFAIPLVTMAVSNTWTLVIIKRSEEAELEQPHPAYAQGKHAPHLVVPQAPGRLIPKTP